MDILLEKKTQQLNDERTEIFALIDRLADSIRRYQHEYAGIDEAEKRDIRQKNSEREQKLMQLESMQKQERENAENRHKRALQKISQGISDEESSAREKLTKYEKNINESIKNENVRINEGKEKNETIIKKCRDICNEFNTKVNRVGVMLKDKHNGKSELDQMKKALKTDVPEIPDRDTALTYLSGDVIKESSELMKTIREITESLPRKILLNGKRSDAIKRLLKIQVDATVALDWIENDLAKAQKKVNDASEKRIRSLREACNKNKQDVIDKRDKKIKELSKETEKENRGYNVFLTGLQASQKKEYIELSSKYESQIKDATLKWTEEKKRCDDKFYSYMVDEQYPKDRMYAWIEQFWNHPVNVEDYGKISGKICLNTLIGVAYLDISDWVSGNTGKTVERVLINYQSLFGRNSNQANKNYREKKILLPYTISIEKGESLMLSHNDAADERAKKMINGIAIRMFRSVPACMMRFMLFDAAGMGSFVDLKELDPAKLNNPEEQTVKSLIFAEARKHSDISMQLSDTESHMSGIEGQLNRYGSLREYNDDNPLSKQVYRPLLMMNYPYGFEEEELRTLNKLLADCSKLGFSMICAQPDRVYQGVNTELKPILNEIAGRQTILRLEAERKSLIVKNSISKCEKRAEIFIYGPHKADKTDMIISDIREDSVEASKITINFSEAKGIIPERNTWFKERRDNGLVVPIGYLEGGQLFKLQFDDQHVNTMIVGMTGSGKSNLLHVLMMNMMLRYDPTEVMIYLIDFKYGFDFSLYTRYNLPSYRTIGIGSDPEYVLEMLKSIEKEQQKRSSLIGNRYKNICEFNAEHPDRRINRIVVIIDELYVLTEKADDKTRKDILNRINVLVHNDRAPGIHFVLAGQDLNKLEYFETIKNQCSTRIALNCEEEQVRQLMDGEGSSKMRMIEQTDSGVGVFSIDKGKNPQIEHTAYLFPKEQDNLLKQIHKHYMDKNVITDVKIMTSRLEYNPNHPLQMFAENGYVQETGGRFMIGDPISLEREVTLKPSGNMWIAGGNATVESDKAGESVMFYLMYSLMLERMKNDSLSMVVTNCSDSRSDEYDELSEFDLAGQLASSYESMFEYGRSGDCTRILSSMLDEMDKRKNGLEDPSKTIWWFLIKPEKDMYLFGNGNAIQDFKELLANGPKYNMHTIVWNYDVSSSKMLVTQIDRSMFSERIFLEMSNDDQRTVNGSDVKPEPKGFKAVLLGSGKSVLFRIYDLPDGMWMNQLFGHINEFLDRR